VVVVLVTLALGHLPVALVEVAVTVAVRQCGMVRQEHPAKGLTEGTQLITDKITLRLAVEVLAVMVKAIRLI
jgi:hypothetical protein